MREKLRRLVGAARSWALSVGRSYWVLVLAVVPVALLVLGLVGGGVVVGAVVVTIVKVDDVVPRFFVFGGLTVTTPCGAVRCGAVRCGSCLYVCASLFTPPVTRRFLRTTPQLVLDDTEAIYRSCKQRMEREGSTVLSSIHFTCSVRPDRVEVRRRRAKNKLMKRGEGRSRCKAPALFLVSTGSSYLCMFPCEWAFFDVVLYVVHVCGRGRTVGRGGF